MRASAGAWVASLAAVTAAARSVSGRGLPSAPSCASSASVAPTVMVPAVALYRMCWPPASREPWEVTSSAGFSAGFSADLSAGLSSPEALAKAGENVTAAATTAARKYLVLVILAPGEMENYCRGERKL